MEDSVRKYEGHTERVVFTGYERGQPQYRPLSDFRRERRAWIGIAIICFVVGMALFWASGALARPGSMSKGLLCDTVEQVIEAVDGVTATQATFNEVEGCGMFVAPVRVPVDVTILARHETDFAIFTIARFILPGLGVQYGYVGVEVKEPKLAL